MGLFDKYDLVLPQALRVNHQMFRYVLHERGIVLDIPTKTNWAFRRFVKALEEKRGVELKAARKAVRELTEKLANANARAERAEMELRELKQAAQAPQKELVNA